MTLATAFTLALTGGAGWGGVIGLVRTSRSGAGPVGSMTAWGLARCARGGRGLRDPPRLGRRPVLSEWATLPKPAAGSDRAHGRIAGVRGVAPVAGQNEPPPC
jgi:hypothetical protein